ncbi:Zn-dependent hydrolase [Aquisalimonas asiatica]|uniref:N-carbamoyl-L-amino-acid hydrolase n=1 Tax=Aquisalimonas asiatica TaxID=406100 RepID=A0A1H8RI21_9GAMM|nr:Zn-dependent hydrolase [Aquisalimonas asiatica]SEO66055.1 N-carbamoyl-L-amino-acid hydrolase [Aquisalimonas asiatica]
MMYADAHKAASHVSGERLWNRLMRLAEIGATAKGGVNRQAMTPEDSQARALMADWARGLGFSVQQDGIGNLFMRRDGRDISRLPIVTGSHLDSQPTGGCFDGVLGVVMALEALEAIQEAGIRTHHPLEIVAWMNEEGSRYGPVCMGSSVYVGRMGLAEACASVASDGAVLGDELPAALAAVAPAEERDFGAPMAAYLESHIEQGPVLEEQGVQLGIVSAIQGIRWFRCEVTGAEAHAGTTPRRMRRDAGQAAMRMIAAMEEAFTDEGDAIRFTVGQFHVDPGSPNVVPGRAAFSIDLRHPDAALLDTLSEQVHAICQEHRGPCQVTVEQVGGVAPVDLAPWMTGVLDDCAAELDVTRMTMPSGAVHDASNMAALCPTAMLFIPSREGISHNEAEWSEPDACRDGARLLAASLVRIDERLSQ